MHRSYGNRVPLSTPCPAPHAARVLIHSQPPQNQRAAIWPAPCSPQCNCASRRGGGKMTTTWKSGDDPSKGQKSAKPATNNTTITENILSSWSRQQKLAMIAGFGILGLMLVVIACSKQSEKPALVRVSNPAAASASNAADSSPTGAAAAPT